MSSNFRNFCHNKRPNFLSQWEHVKKLRFDTILFVSSCLLISEIPVKKGRISYHNESNKSFDTILFVSSCLQIDKKGRISYYNESNKKFWHHTFCVLIMFKFQKFLSQKGRISYSNESNQKFWLSLQHLQTDSAKEVGLEEASNSNIQNGWYISVVQLIIMKTNQREKPLIVFWW